MMKHSIQRNNVNVLLLTSSCLSRCSNNFMTTMKKNKRICLWLSFTVLELICLYRYQCQQNVHPSYSSSLRSTKRSIGKNYQSPSFPHNHPPIPKSPSRTKSTNIRSIYKNHKLSLLGINFNITTSLSKITEEKLDWDSIDVPEPGYPKRTHLVDYGTSATENEIEKHDRLLVQSFYYMKHFIHDSTKDHNKNNHVNNQREERKKKSKENYIIDNERKNYLRQREAIITATNNDNGDNTNNQTNPIICLNIYLCNRRIPYINSLFMTLTSFSNNQHKQQFISSTQVHLLNTEKRNDRLHFPYLQHQLSKIDFVYDVHNITYPDDIYVNVAKERELDFRETFISDTISGLKICIDSGLPYCVLMEEDAVVPVDFISLLLDQVIKPLQKKGMLNSNDGSGSISVLSLYSYYNLVFFGPHRLHFTRYSKNKYQDDKAKLNIERWGRNMFPFHPQYNVLNKDYKYGTVAMFYTRQSAVELVKYMSKVGVDPIHNADEFINANEYFPTVMGMKRKHVSPSLVNHIGFYSERMAAVKSRGMFSQLNTDSRFMYDAGTL